MDTKITVSGPGGTLYGIVEIIKLALEAHNAKVDVAIYADDLRYSNTREIQEMNERVKSNKDLSGFHLQIVRNDCPWGG